MYNNVIKDARTTFVSNRLFRSYSCEGGGCGGIWGEGQILVFMGGRTKIPNLSRGKGGCQILPNTNYQNQLSFTNYFHGQHSDYYYEPNILEIPIFQGGGGGRCQISPNNIYQNQLSFTNYFHHQHSDYHYEPIILEIPNLSRRGRGNSQSFNEGGKFPIFQGGGNSQSFKEGRKFPIFQGGGEFPIFQGGGGGIPNLSRRGGSRFCQILIIKISSVLLTISIINTLITTMSQSY